MVIVGERDYANTIFTADSSDVQGIRVCGVRTQTGDRQADFMGIEFIDSALRSVENHGIDALLIQSMHQPLAGVTESANKVERLLNTPDAACKGVAPHQANEAVILEQGENLADAIKPTDHRGVNHDDRPGSLARGKGVGDFAKTDGRAHKADKIERVEKIHTPGVALVIYPRD